jgi:hypothetical protein
MKVEGRTFQQFHHEKGATVVGDSIVEDTNNRRMIDAIRDVPFDEEALHDGSVHDEIAPKHLNRHPMSIAVARSIDGRHAAAPEDAFKRPSFGKERPDSDIVSGFRTHRAREHARTFRSWPNFFGQFGHKFRPSL